MAVSLRSLLVLAPFAVVVAACSSAPESPTESTEAPLSVGGTAPAPNKTWLPPPPPPPTCWWTSEPAPGCSIRPLDGATNPTQQLLGCGEIFSYHNGANAGLLGGTGSYCPDTPSNHAYLQAHGMHGFSGGYDDTCIEVPCGQIFVFWSYFMGPNCPSSCHFVPGPPAI